MGWQYRITDLDNAGRDYGPEYVVEDEEQAQSALALQQQGFPWPDRIVIQKRWVGDWEPLEGSPQYWEDATTEGPRKAWEDADLPPEADAGWELDYSRGRPGEAWDRFEHTEERYWRRWVGEGERPADEMTPYVGATGERLTIEEARVTRRFDLMPIAWAPENEKLR